MEIQEFYNKYEKKVAQEVRSFTLGVLTNIVKGTPVDTGSARSNWGVGKTPNRSINRPFVNYEIVKFTGNKFLESSNAQRAIRRAAKKLDRLKLLGDIDLYISNPLGYIMDLEEGKSKQNRNFIHDGLLKAKSRSKFFGQG